jgi:hypothetical protein
MRETPTLLLHGGFFFTIRGSSDEQQVVRARDSTLDAIGGERADATRKRVLWT